MITHTLFALVYEQVEDALEQIEEHARVTMKERGHTVINAEAHYATLEVLTDIPSEVLHAAITNGAAIAVAFIDTTSSSDTDCKD